MSGFGSGVASCVPIACDVFCKNFATVAGDGGEPPLALLVMTSHPNWLKQLSICEPTGGAPPNPTFDLQWGWFAS
jgi:hypothetical protein